MIILVVDDSRTIRLLVTECIKNMGFEVVYAETGEQCLQYLAANNVDLVLMDIEMPGMNGIAATKAIRALKQDDWFPIIFLSSMTDDKAYSDGIMAGGDAYLSKPLDPLRLQMTIVAMERIYLMRQKLKKTQLDLETANRALEQLSLTDKLSGLANRRYFDQTLQQQFISAGRTKCPLSLIICDIDFFKSYNDHYGHQAGDRCLSAVANLIRAQAKRAGDLACRYGGEEFTLILPQATLVSALEIAELVRQAVMNSQMPHISSKIGDIVTLSLGVSSYTGQFQSAEQLLKAADLALYKAKAAGRNRVEFALALS